MYERGVLLDRPPAEVESGLILPAGLEDLMALERQTWGRDLREVRDSGAPSAMPHQGFRAQFPNNQDPPIVNGTQTAAAEDKILWDPAGLAPQTAIPANTLYAGAILKITAWGIYDSAVTGAQTAIFTPRFGTTTGGTSLGVSRTQPVAAVAFTTQPWFLEMFFHVRSIGSTGTATCGGVVTAQHLVGTAATTNTAPVNFGTSSATATTINTTTASGLLVSVNCSLATQKWTTMGVVMESLN